MMRAVLLSLLLLIGFGGAATPGSAGQSASRGGWVPHHLGHVNDHAGVVNAEERAALEAVLNAYRLETTHEIAVLTVSSLRGEAIDAFSLRVANAWKLGRKGSDNGILMTVAPTERQVRIEVGTGMARFISDADAKQIIDETLLPAFRAGQFGRGITRGVERLMDAARAYREVKVLNPTGTTP